VEAVYSFPLPLKLISFTGTVSGNTNFLKWETTDEVNTHRFEIERSDDGIHFTSIGNISARNSPGNNLYSYTDNKVQSVIYFYRLKMVDIDSKFTYSKTIRVVNAADKQIAIIFQPVSDHLKIIGVKAGAVISIIDLQGKTILKVNANPDLQSIPVNGLSAGTYFVRYVYKNEISVLKFVKM
jgi:hypothetical protein